jgi:hypothetical protein
LILLATSHECPAIIDSNQNGLSDIWEKQFNGDSLFDPNHLGHAPEADPDKDGWNNIAEATAGTNPFLPNTPQGITRLNISSTSARGFFKIDCPSIIGKSYQIQGSYDFLTWHEITEPILSHQNSLTCFSGVSTLDGEPAQRYFWRTKITDLDSDNDGLTNAEEHSLETNPHHHDTDNDGISDKNELLRSLDPLNPDSDADALFDGFEDSIQTNPANPDTDNDTIFDGQELANDTNPLLADSDGDGLSDHQEAELSTNPSHSDTDGDGILDGAEMANGTNPLLNDSDADGVLDGVDSTPSLNNVESSPDLAGLSPSLSNGLSSLWAFEEIQNFTFQDLSAPGYANLITSENPAKIVGTSLSTEGMISKSVNLSQAHNCLVANPQVFSGKPNWTISLWFKMPQSYLQTKQGTLNTVIWAYNNSNDPYPEFQIHAYKAVTGNDQQKITISHYHNGIYQPDLITYIPLSNPLDNNSWQHLTVTYHSGTVKLYRNAILLNQFSTATTAYTPDHTGYFAIGRLHPSTTSDTAFRGKMDRFAIHDRSLSPGEIADLYNLDSDKDTVSDRLEIATALWRDNDGNGLSDNGETSHLRSPFRWEPLDTDTDGDGLPDLQEITLGTQIYHPDSDGDLMPDGWEIANNLDPKLPSDAAQDTEGDGLSNFDEFRHNTSPILSDSDEDGTSDAIEAKGADGILSTDDGSNPNDPSDGGQRPLAQHLITLKLGVGDRSGSASEDYVLHAFQIQPDGAEKRIYTLRSGGFGQYTEEIRSFPAKHTYTFQIDWQATNNNSLSPGTPDSEGADFDYHLVVEPISGHQGHVLIDSYDPLHKRANPQYKLIDSHDILPSDDDDDNAALFRYTHEPNRVLLMRLGLIVDADRDGNFTAADESLITPQKPWRIWKNNDNDWFETGGNDIPDHDWMNRDSSNHYIDQERDLVDFFPMTMRLQDALTVFPATSHRYAIAHDGQPPLAPAFRVVWVPSHQLSANHGPCDNHHKDIEYARSLKTLQSHRIHNSNNGRSIPDAMLESLAQGNGLILVEGSTTTTHPIQLQIRRKDDNSLVASSELPFRVCEVEDMFRTVNLMHVTTEYDNTPRNRDSQGVITRTTEPPSYPDSETNGKYFAFIHGFNVSPAKSKGWNAEIFKRMHQLGSKARFIGITWDSDELLPNYHRAVFQAFQTGDALDAALSFTAGSDLTIVAHSLGNMVVSHAIQSGGFLPNRYYAINAAVPREAYSSSGISLPEQRSMVESGWKNYWDYNPTTAVEPPLKHLLAAHWHQRFPPDDNRSKLTWKDRFIDISNRTDFYNFHSEGDDVVRDADPENDSASVLRTALSGNGFSAYSWAAQEYVKGGTSGAMFAMLPIDRIQAGWSLNISHMNYEIFGNSGQFMPISPAGASTIATSTLTAEPFFGKLKELNLHHPALGVGTLGSQTAGIHKVRYDLLARSIPAMSFAAATHSIPNAADNFDMQSTMRTDPDEWPTDNHSGNLRFDKWLHSDFKDVALLHVYKMFQQMIQTGNLNR